MDGLSAAASIVALCQLTSEVVQYLNHARHAPEECQQCIIEASNLLGPLISLRFRAEQAQSGDPWFEELRKLNVNDGPLDQYKEALELLRKRIEIGDGIQKVKKRILWKFSEKQVTAILERIERLKSLVSIALEMDHSRLSAAIKDDTASIRASLPPLQASATAIEEGVRTLQVETSSMKEDTGFIRDVLPPLQASTDAVRDAQRLQRHQNIVEWLSPSDFPAQQHDFITRRQEGTGQWFIDSEEFNDWQHGPVKTLFCPGNPGTGKTMLAAVTVDHLHKTTHSNDVGIACVFCSYKALVDQTATNLLASILKQLIRSRQDIATRVTALYCQHSNKGTKPSLDELVQALLLVCSGYHTVFIVVDALDECTNTANGRRQLIDKLHSLQFNANVRLLFTSRPIPDVTQDFQHTPWLKIEASEDDVRSYVAGQIPRLPKCVQRDENLKDIVETKIVEAVDGMFLLARLHVDSLLDKRNKERVLTTLNNLSKGSTALEDAYGEAFKRIDAQLDDDRLLAKRALCWLSYAKRVLTATELCCALAIGSGDKSLNLDNLYEVDDIIDVCAGLVTIDDDSGIIRLVHYTTQEYLERVRLEWHPKAQEEIAVACLTYLSFDDFKTGSCTSRKDLEKRLTENQLLNYSACYWHEHVRPVETSVTDSALAFLCDRASTTSAEHAASVSGTIHWSQRRYHQYRTTTGLQLTAKHGLLHLTKKILAAAKCRDNDTRVGAREKGDRMALYNAVCYGHEQVIKLLHNEGGRLDVQKSFSLVSLASTHGHEAVVKLLLELGADINSHGGYHPHALFWASLYGHEAIVKILLDAGADVNRQDGSLGTALQEASRRGHEVIVKLLLDAGADVNIQSCRLGTALQEASRRGYEVIVKLLLDAGADVNIQGCRLGTALQEASRRGYEVIFKLLLDAGADVNAQGGNHRNMLQVASAAGKEGKVKLLLNAGADVNVEGRRYGSALHAASIRGHNEVVRLLIDRGANPMVRSPSGWLPFQAALVRGHDKVASTLWEAMWKDCRGDLHAANPNAGKPSTQGMPQDGCLPTGLPEELLYVNGWSVLHWACRTAKPSVIHMMLKSGLKDKYRATGEPPEYWSAYSIAVFHDNRELLNDMSNDQAIGQQPTMSSFLESRISREADLPFWPPDCDGCNFVCGHPPGTSKADIDRSSTVRNTSV